MEQLIPVIEFLKKNRFWLTCGLVAVACVVTWYLAASSLHQQRMIAQGKINAMDTSGKNVIKTGSDGIKDPIAHPNDHTEKGMIEQIDLASDSLLKAWDARRKAQEPVLQWPEMPNEKLMNTFEGLLPAEKFMEELISANIESSLAVYKNEIPKQMKPICEIIGAKWSFDKSESSESDDEKKTNGGTGDDRTPESVAASEQTDSTIVVEWNQENQQLWQDKLTKFSGIDGHSGATDTPTPIQVIALQQDLWLLEAMYRIIKDVNGEADANDLAVIKRIDHVVFGREARTQLGSLVDPDPRLAPAGKSVKKTSSVPQEEKSRNVFGTGKRVDPNAFNPDPGPGLKKYGPFHGRYVDSNFKPIPATTLQAVLNGETLPKDNLELVVAKRVPVRIALRMDDQKIDDFIAACGNSPFAFEVWQVRIDRPLDKIEMAGVTDNSSASKERSDGQVRGEVASGGGGGKNLSEEGGAGGAGESAADAEDAEVDMRKTYDVNVEFYGIVKIYNPVDESIITGKKKADDKVKPNP